VKERKQVQYNEMENEEIETNSLLRKKKNGRKQARWEEGRLGE